MRKAVILLMLALMVLAVSCKQDPEPEDAGASYVMTKEGTSEVWYFDMSDVKLFEHYTLQGSVKIPEDNGRWSLDGTNLVLECRGSWSMYSATTESGIRLDIAGDTYEMNATAEGWEYHDGFKACTLTLSDGSFTLVLTDSWHSITYTGSYEDFKAIDKMYTAGRKTVVHVGVTMGDNVLEIDGNRFSRM